jgi:hypothetical protein
MLDSEQIADLFFIDFNNAHFYIEFYVFLVLLDFLENSVHNAGHNPFHPLVENIPLHGKGLS